MNRASGLRVLAVASTVFSPFFASMAQAVDLSGFDIVGLKIGMPLADARASIKARKLPRYAESKGQLTYMTDAGAFPDVPNGAYTSAITAYTVFRDRTGNILQDFDHILLNLTPDPGHERVVRITRRVGFSQQNVVLESVLINGLSAKYGKPAMVDVMGSHNMAWGPAPVQGTVFQNCADFRLPEWIADELASIPDYVLGNDGPTIGVNAQKCSVFMAVRINTVNPNDPPERRVVSEYTISLIGHALRAEAVKTAAAISAAAKQAQSEGQSARAKDQKKPEL